MKNRRSPRLLYVAGDALPVANMENLEGGPLLAIYIASDLEHVGTKRTSARKRRSRSPIDGIATASSTQLCRRRLNAPRPSNLAWARLYSRNEINGETGFIERFCDGYEVGRASLMSVLLATEQLFFCRLSLVAVPSTTRRLRRAQARVDTALFSGCCRRIRSNQGSDAVTSVATESLLRL